MASKGPHSERSVSTYCYQCVAGPDLLTVRVEDGTATEIRPNFAAAEVHPAGGKVCVKAFGLVQKAYNPARILHPMKRTNPKKGRGEDPGFVPISWDEALDLVAGKLNAARAAGLLDEAGYPRLAAQRFTLDLDRLADTRVVEELVGDTANRRHRDVADPTWAATSAAGRARC